MRRFLYVLAALLVYVVIKWAIGKARWTAPSPRVGFVQVVCDPIPSSVKIVKSSFSRSVMEEDIVNIRYYFAFTSNSNDVQRILSAKAFQAGGDRSLPPDPASAADKTMQTWFPVESIGTNGQFFSFTAGNRKDRLWINESGTNCFYVYELRK